MKRFLVGDHRTHVLAVGSCSAGRSAGRPASVVERRALETDDRRFRRQGDKEGSPDFVPSAQRIATFDNDGTLWAEQPLYFQGLFVFDRVRALAPQHPEWKKNNRSRRCSKTT